MGMKSHKIITPSKWNSNDLVFTDVKVNNYGGKVVYVNHVNGGNIRIQTPEMSMPYGLTENEILDKKTNEVIGHKYTTNLSFKDMNGDSKESQKLKKFHNM